MTYKILVVDDEKDIVEVIKNRLVREGYEVSVAYDGQEALDKVKADDPDILLLDLNMPKLNGFQVLERVRKDFTDKWRPVIIISARSELDSVEKCYSMEADHYLTKPCQMEHILAGIKTMISLMQARIKE